MEFCNKKKRYCCKVLRREGHGFSKKASFQLSVIDKQTQLLASVNKRYEVINEYNDLVWCIRCNNKNFIARREGSVFLTGNCHENSLEDSRYVNVSCEVIDYTPQLLDNYIR